MTNLRIILLSIGLILIITAFMCDMSHRGQVSNIGLGIGLTIFSGMLEDY